MFGLSFYEKSAWGTFVALLVLGGFYFSAVWDLWTADLLIGPAVFGLAVGFTVLLVVVLVIFHVLIAIIDRPGDEDERDRLIGWRAAQWSSFTMVAGVISIVCLVLFAGVLQDSDLHSRIYSPMAIVQLMMILVLAAQLLELLVRIILYRRGT